MILTEQHRLIDEILSGRTDRFGIIVDTYSDRIHALVAGIAGDPMTADELTQDVFIKAFRTLGSFKKSSSLETWLYRISYNTAIDHTRKQRNEALRLDDLQLERLSDTDVGNLLDSEDDTDPRLALLPDALDRLPADDRALLTFFYYEDMSVRDISAVTGIKESNIKVKLLRARKKLYAIITHLNQ